MVDKKFAVIVNIPVSFSHDFEHRVISISKTVIKRASSYKVINKFLCNTNESYIYTSRNRLFIKILKLITIVHASVSKYSSDSSEVAYLSLLIYLQVDNQRFYFDLKSQSIICKTFIFHCHR